MPSTSQTQHTPGPWRVSDRARYVVVAPEAHGKAICCMRNTQEDADHPANVVADANARLIAAAPEMLRALQEVVYSYDDDSGASLMIRMEAVMPIIRLAIRVARGHDHGPGHNVDRTNVENRQHSCPDSSAVKGGS